MGWIFLSTAVLANILANIMFKKAMLAFPTEPDLASVFKFMFNPHLWIGGVSCVLLLSCYLLAIRGLGLSVSYAFVTSLSLIGITLVAALLFGESLTLQSGLGVILVISGLLMIANTTGTNTHIVPSETATTGADQELLSKP